MRQLTVPARLLVIVIAVAASAGCMRVTDHPAKPRSTASTGARGSQAGPDAVAARGGAGGDVHGVAEQEAQHGGKERKGANAEDDAASAAPGPEAPVPSGAPAPRRSRPADPSVPGGGPSWLPADSPPPSPPPPSPPTSEPLAESPSPDPGDSPPGAIPQPRPEPGKRTGAMALLMASPQAGPV